MSITLRFIPTLMEETNKIICAQKARGAQFDTGNLVQRVKAFVPILIPLLVNSFRRAEELALAMNARCFEGSTKRTRLKKLKCSWRDLFAVYNRHRGGVGRKIRRRGLDSRSFQYKRGLDEVVSL